MTTVDNIKKTLTERFYPTHLEVHDDSAAHAGHPGASSGGGHYTVVIVAETFSTHSTVSRHRLVYAALHEEMKENIHALGLQAFTPSEWQSRQEAR